MQHTYQFRAVMSAEEYQQARQRLEATYGDLNSDDAVLAKRDQALADLFYQSGWTQEQLAAQEGKTQQWVALRLRLGRFLAYSPNTTAVVMGLTEWRFRGSWERTDKSASESARFDAVIRMLQDPAPPKPKPRSEKIEFPAPVTDQVRAIIRPLIEAGQPVDRNKIHDEHGVSMQPIIMAVYYERGRLEGLKEAAETVPPAAPDLAPSMLGKSAQERFAALEVRLRARMEAEFVGRVQSEVARNIEEYVMPYYGERLAKADLLMKTGKPFTNAQFLNLLRALHADSSNPENRQAAFVLLKEKEVLLRPEEKDRPLSSGLPKTLAELMARKKAMKS